MRLADVLLAYSEWLDSEGLMKAEPIDGRTHEDLVGLFRQSYEAGAPLDEVLGVNAVLWDNTGRRPLHADAGEPDLVDDDEDEATPRREARWSAAQGKWVDAETGEPIDLPHLRPGAAEIIDAVKGYEFPTTEDHSIKMPTDDGEDGDEAWAAPDDIVKATYEELIKIVQGKATAPAFSDGSGGRRAPAFDERLRAAEAILGDGRNAEVTLNVNGLNGFRIERGDS